jgi:hypothetical protein
VINSLPSKPGFKPQTYKTASQHATNSAMLPPKNWFIINRAVDDIHGGQKKPIDPLNFRYWTFFGNQNMPKMSTQPPTPKKGSKNCL